MSDTSYNTYDKITSIDWNGRYFILTARSEIAGNTFSYAHSFDGNSWIKSDFYTNVTTKNPYSTKFLGDKFLITGNIITSSSQESLINIVDGQFPVAIPANLENTIIYDIERNLEQPHRIVFPKTTALALGNTIAYSNNQGQSWSNVGPSPFSTSINDAVWNGKVWVAGGTGANTIATSLDGVHWAGRGNYIFSVTCNGVDWSPPQKKYAAIGSGTNVVATSMDGVYWRGTNTVLFSSTGNDIKYGNNVWVAVGNTASSGNTIAYSSDAVSWQYAANSFQTSGEYIYFDGVIWTIYGQDPSYNIATSSDSIHWTLSYVSGANSLAFNLKTVPYPLEPCTIISNLNKYTHNHSDRGCAYIQPISLACGSGSNSLAYSVDGIQWTSINTSLFSNCNKAVWNGTLWVVVGAGTYWVATSPDGLCWTGRENSIMTECYDIAWNGTYFVAVGVGSSLMAKSSNGITWTALTVEVFSVSVHAIEWTGNVWLAYGEGINTTAISTYIDASGWTSTTTPNLCIIDCSSILLSNINAISASSQQGANIPANAFDGSFNTTVTKWSSGSNYDASGNYIGTTVTQDISGEWLQVQLTTSLSCKNYYIIFAVADGSAIPQSWSLLGSNNGTSWTLIDTFNYGTSTPPNNNWKYPFVCLPLTISSGSYSYYRVVFTSSFGADYVSVAELALFDGGANQLDQYIRPIVLKDLILHPTRILSIDGTVPNIYRITDLSCNLIRTGIVHGGQYVNNTLYGLSSKPSAIVFDGLNHVVLSSSGEVSYLSNNASNTNLNFDNSMNGFAITGVTGTINAACYNSKFILIGSFYGVLNETTPIFYSNNLSSLFTTINGLASNSGYGVVVSSNTIYLKEDERLSVVTPKYHDSALSSDTSISFNVWKSI